MDTTSIIEADHPPMLSLTETAAMLRCHPNTVRAWVRQGKLTAIPMGPEKVNMFLKADVERLKKPLERAGVIVKEDKHAFPVVGIGASAGGLDAMSRLLQRLPTDLGLAYVFVTHQEKDQEKTLCDLLRKKTTMPVFVVENGMKLEPDRLYVNPAGMHTAVINGTFTLQVPRGVHGQANRPVDAFFTALANEYQNNAIGIVLSGGGMDGTEGLRAIKAEDGLTIAQDGSAQDKGMPESAQEAGVVDLVRAPEDIGPELVQLIKELYPGGKARIPSKHENELRRILQYVLEQRGVDFSEYKESTIHRRIIRRMVLSKCRKLSEYSALLRGIPTELDTLYSDLLINVTSFFRDPAFHKALSEGVFPDLFKERSATDTLRIWVPACAGGEEVVSIAITLLEFLGEQAMNTPVQIFATDLNERTIEKARLGIYKKSALQDMAPERVAKFFMHVDGHYQVIKPIRDMCVFAKHDLLKDPPFSRVDLISCQNVLIYLEGPAQGRILKSFHYALKPTGFLVLGKSETPANAGDIFIQPEREHKVYRKKRRGNSRLDFDLRYKPAPAATSSNGSGPAMTRLAGPRGDLDRELEQLLLHRYVPASVLVNKDLEIVRFLGSSAPFLGPSAGRASLSLLKMVRDDLAFELRALLHKARNENIPVRKSGIPIRLNSGLQDVSIEVLPLGGTPGPHFLVLFKEEGVAVAADMPAAKGDPGKRAIDVRDKRIAQLEQELRDAREQVRLVSEESEITLQELQAANEEVVSSNEELQSINEELETSKEELQSINEEFATINEELQSRNECLLESEERYRKLIDLMPVAVYTCDTSGHVRLFNEAAVRLWGRTPVVGEALRYGSASMRTAEGPLDRCPMAVAIKEERAMADIEAVVVQPNGEQRAVLANPTPLYDHHGKISGAINVLVDITERQQLSGMLERSLNEIYIFDLEELRFEYVNHGALSNLGYTLEQMRAMTPVDIKPELDVRQFEALVRPLRSGQKEKLLFHTIHRRADGSDYPVEVHLQIVNNGPKRSFMAMILDITERKLDEERLRVVTNTGKLGIWDWDIEADTITWTDPVYEVHGVVKGAFEPTMAGYAELIHPEDRDRVTTAIKKSLEEDAPYEIEFRARNASGVVHWVYTSGVVLRANGRPVRMMGGTMNITRRKEAEEAARRLAAIVESSDDAIISKDLNGILTSWNKGAERMFGYTPEEIIGKPNTVLFPADRQEEEKLLFERLKQGEHIEHYETVRLRKDGTPLDVSLALSPLKNDRGEIVGASKTIRDVTESKRAREAVRESEERFHLLADSMAQLAWIVDETGKAIWFNRRWFDYTGLDAEGIRENVGRNVVHPDHSERMIEALRHSLAQGTDFELVFPLRRHDGEYRWFLSRMLPVRNEAGKVVRWFGTNTDVTAELAAREELQQSEERFRLLADNIGQLAWMAEPAGDINWYNKRWFEYSGTTLEEMRGWGWQKVHHPDHVEAVTAKFKAHIEQEKDWEDTFPIRGADGQYRWFLSRAFPVRDEQGKVVRWFGTNTDVTDERAAREELQQSEERFRLLADNVKQLIWMAPADGSSMWFNKRWHEFTGMTGEQIRMDAKSLHHPDHYDRAINSLRECAAKGEPWEDTFPLKGKDGKYHWFLATAMPVHNAEGKVVRWFGTCTDITTAREAQALIYENEERFRMLADNMSQMAYVADADGRITWVNRRWTDYTGMGVEEMNDGGWGKAVDPAHFDDMVASYSIAQQKGEPWEYVFRVKSTTGEYRWFLSRSVPILGEDGKVERWFGTNTDITAQKLAEEALEESAKHKDHFLATLAHELRNPLAPLKNGLQLMELAPDDPQLLETTREMMVRQLDHMVRLVDDLMDLSRISRGKIDLQKEDMALHHAVSMAMEASKPLIDRNRHHLEVILQEANLVVHGDVARLTQVVSNLLNNAAKYTAPGGRIELNMRKEGDQAVISVKDNGIGISPDAMPRVFDMFTQVDPHINNNATGGLGIGLNVVQRLVRMHHGDVEGRSEGLGKGSEFIVRLPLVATTEKPKDGEMVKDTLAALSKRRVLVVDDNEDIALSMSMILKKIGHTVAVANDGEHAVAMAESFRPDVILMDIGMPRMNGYEACATIRKTEHGKRIHIIAVSGWGQEEDRKKSQDAGFDGHVVKPMEKATLERVIAEAKPHVGA